MAHATETRQFVPATVYSFSHKTRNGAVRMGDMTLTFKFDDALAGSEEPAVGQEIFVHLGSDGRRKVIEAWKPAE
ncbi:MAG: hypothetical protein NVSMB39_4030 [Candidatus Saccharimonadales bacterium]